MQPATSTTCPAPKSPADQLKDLSVILRSDLHVSRQLHQGQPVYVVHDPISFRTHRLTLQNYQVLVRLDPSKTIGQNFQTLVQQRHFSTSDQDFYYQYIMQLHQLGLIVLPVANGGRLFEQHQKQSKLKRRSKIYGALFMQIPLARPDLFLTRTAPQMRVLFSRGFLTLWAVAGLVALWLVASRFDEFMKPLNSLLATENLPFLWSAFVVLKIWHELGHGYACKIHGGAVPEMGMPLSAGTPAAYVDATAAWSFPERWKRLVVMLGGMYFETIVAIPAVFIWAFSSSPMLSSCAYQLVMMASLITVLFNANPLMKYDGYFIAGELLGIQNLRGRSDQLIKDVLKRVFLGLPTNVSVTSTRERWILPIYGDDLVEVSAGRFGDRRISACHDDRNVRVEARNLSADQSRNSFCAHASDDCCRTCPCRAADLDVFRSDAIWDRGFRCRCGRERALSERGYSGSVRVGQR